jgi:hypothetical protein
MSEDGKLVAWMRFVVNREIRFVAEFTLGPKIARLVLVALLALPLCSTNNAHPAPHNAGHFSIFRYSYNRRVINLKLLFTPLQVAIVLRPLAGRPASNIGEAALLWGKDAQTAPICWTELPSGLDHSITSG